MHAVSAFIAGTPPLVARGLAGNTLTPEQFGALGDGRTDDSAAFAALSDAINAVGGGTIALRRVVYLVGTLGPDLKPRHLLELRGCSGPINIKGNGAVLRCASGQPYGAFTRDLNAISEPIKKGDGRLLLKPYSAMVLVENCSGPVTIEDLELDGNISGLLIGGPHGGASWQIGCWGLALRNNSGSECVANVWAHDQAQDGFYIDGVDSAGATVTRQLVRIRAHRNARQGLSLVGGHDYTIVASEFSQTGRSVIHSAPGAGVDIEAQRGKRVRRIRFFDCNFADNHGCGLVADSGDSADLSFSRCTFVGTTNWSVWARKPGMLFNNCRFVGSIVHGFADPDPARATRFSNCAFTDDNARSPNGMVYLRKNIIAHLPRAQNVLFERCRFELRRNGVLPWSVGPIWRDCRMSQVSKQIAHTRGTFQGINRIDGSVSIAKSVVEGVLYLNGKLIPRQANIV